MKTMPIFFWMLALTCDYCKCKDLLMKTFAGPTGTVSDKGLPDSAILAAPSMIFVTIRRFGGLLIACRSEV